MVRPNPGMIRSFFFFLSFLLLHCHQNSSFSFKSYCISLVSINLPLSLCLPFHFSSPRIPPSILCPALPLPPGLATTLVFPKSSAIRHLQRINYTVLTQLDWGSNIYTPPPQTPMLPLHLHPLTDFQCFFLYLCFSCFASFLRLPLYSPSPKTFTFDSRPHPDLLCTKMTTAVTPGLFWARELC